MKQLNALFAVAFKSPEDYQNQPPTDDYLKGFLASGDHIVLAAMADEKVVGGLVAYCFPKFEQQRKEIYLYDLAVSSNHQRQGIGRQLMTELQKIAREIGAYVVFVQADEGDGAIKFYQSLDPTESQRTRNFDFYIN
jgi:aminoglycoside 3-N-acetyltransferase I